MSHLIPIELLCHIFSFLEYHELYLTRSVCKQWQALAEEYIYLAIKAKQQHVRITLGQSPCLSTMDLYADNYDASHRIVEFIPRQDCTVVSPPSLYNTGTANTSWHLYHHRQMQVRFSQWPTRPLSPSWLTGLSPSEQAQAKFHLEYNPALECSYALPAYGWFSSSPSSSSCQQQQQQQQQQQHYVGDKTLILSFSYIHSRPPSPSQGETSSLSPVSSVSSLHIPADSNSSSPPLGAPQIKIHWLRVTLDWIISGSQPRMQPIQIYADRYAQLYHTLTYQYGCYKYDELSEPVLAHIIQQDDSILSPASTSLSPPSSPSISSIYSSSSFSSSSSTLESSSYDFNESSSLSIKKKSSITASSAPTTTTTTSTSTSTTTDAPMMQEGVCAPFLMQKANNTIKNDYNSNYDYETALPKPLLSYIQEHTHEYQTRLSRLQHMLEGACVDPKMLWKYPFAKSFVVGNGSLLSEEDVVRRIHDSEDEWRTLSHRLKKRLGHSLDLYS